MALRTKQFYPIQGMEKVLKNLNRQVAKIQGATLGGLVQGGFLVQRDAQKLCPVDFGNLRASAYTMWTTKRFAEDVSQRFMRLVGGGSEGFPVESIFKRGRTEVIRRVEGDYGQILEDAKAEVDSAAAKGIMAVQVGFTAYYAIYVHEDAEAKHPVGQYRFLLASLEQNQGRILQIVANKARIR